MCGAEPHPMRRFQRDGLGKLAAFVSQVRSLVPLKSRRTYRFEPASRSALLVFWVVVGVAKTATKTHLWLTKLPSSAFSASFPSRLAL